MEKNLKFEDCISIIKRAWLGLGDDLLISYKIKTYDRKHEYKGGFSCPQVSSSLVSITEKGKLRSRNLYYILENLPYFSEKEEGETSYLYKKSEGIGLVFSYQGRATYEIKAFQKKLLNKFRIKISMECYYQITGRELVGGPAICAVGEVYHDVSGKEPAFEMEIKFTSTKSLEDLLQPR